MQPGHPDVTKGLPVLITRRSVCTINSEAYEAVSIKLHSFVPRCSVQNQVTCNLNPPVQRDFRGRFLGQCCPWNGREREESWKNTHVDTVLNRLDHLLLGFSDADDQVRADHFFSEDFYSVPEELQLSFPAVWTACVGAFDLVEDLFRCGVQRYAYSLRSGLCQRERCLLFSWAGMTPRLAFGSANGLLEPERRDPRTLRDNSMLECRLSRFLLSFELLLFPRELFSLDRLARRLLRACPFCCCSLWLRAETTVCCALLLSVGHQVSRCGWSVQFGLQEAQHCGGTNGNANEFGQEIVFDHEFSRVLHPDSF